MISIPDLLPGLPLIALYAETHYRFCRFFPSLLYRRQPEVVFDAPRRVGPHEDVPVSLIVNDIGRFPAHVRSVSIAVNRPGFAAQFFAFDAPAACEISHPLSKQSRAYLFRIPRDRIALGPVYLNARACLRIGKRCIDVLNDNLPMSSQAPLQCLITDDCLPGADQCLYGDVHTHTQFSQSHVEFGPPPAVIAAMAKAYGLAFFAATDHSYDLACSVDNYLVEDPSVRRWELLSQSIRDASFVGPIIICGEEVSCLNNRGRTVHALALGIREYVAGSMDGARIGKTNATRYTIAGAAAEARRQGGILIAAHPRARFGFLQKMLLRRGIWENADFAADIDGLQAANNGFTYAFEDARRRWVNELLKGRRIPLFAGSDCHGDFNRYRFLRTPFISIGESFERYFGSTCTGVYGKPQNSRQLIESMRDGHTFITNGPFCSIELNDDSPRSLIGNKAIPCGNQTLALRAITNKEFGPIRCARIMRGIIGQQNETPIFSENYSADDRCFSIRKELTAANLSDSGYLRAELLCTSSDGKQSLAFTSPCYFEK